MELIDSKVEVITPSGYSLDDIFFDIAKAGRICYASERVDKNSEFVSVCIKRGHGRPLEFGTVYLSKLFTGESDKRFGDWEKYATNPYSRIHLHDGWLYVTTNYRVLVDNDWLGDLKYLSNPTPWHERRYTLHWTISRAIADEFRTHVAISSLMQSTRYCNYSKDKFGNQLTFVRPHWITLEPGYYDWKWMSDKNSLGIGPKNFEWIINSLMTETRYILFTTQLGVLAEDARSILPLDIKTEFIQCAFESDWKHFFDLRAHNTTGKAHPDSIKIALEAERMLTDINGELGIKNEGC